MVYSLGYCQWREAGIQHGPYSQQELGQRLRGRSAILISRRIELIRHLDGSYFIKGLRQCGSDRLTNSKSFLVILDPAHEYHGSKIADVDNARRGQTGPFYSKSILGQMSQCAQMRSQFRDSCRINHLFSSVTSFTKRKKPQTRSAANLRKIVGS